MLEKDVAKRKCEAGNEDYCPTIQTHPGEVIGFAATALIGGFSLEYFILGGGAAGALAGAEAAYQTVYSKAALTCIKSAVCRGLFGLAGGLPATRVFWSGGDAAKQEAQEWAAANNGITLNQTLGGRVAEAASKILPYQIMKPVWDSLSRNFAQGATGNVPVFINPSAYNAESSTWATTELETLIMNPKVQNIIGFFLGKQ